MVRLITDIQSISSQSHLPENTDWVVILPWITGSFHAEDRSLGQLISWTSTQIPGIGVPYSVRVTLTWSPCRHARPEVLFAELPESTRGIALSPWNICFIVSVVRPYCKRAIIQQSQVTEPAAVPVRYGSMFKCWERRWVVTIVYTGLQYFCHIGIRLTRYPALVFAKLNYAI